MIFDEMKMWRALNAIEAAAALGFNDMTLCEADRRHIKEYLMQRATEQDERRARFPNTARKLVA